MAKREKVGKTNAMRELERAGIDFEVRMYEVDESDLSGIHVAEQLGEDARQGFKTLVCAAPSGGHVVCCIPVAAEVDLKAAAAAAGEKSLSLIPVKELLPLTGYMRGGCSPIGMKKRFPTIVDESCGNWDCIFISGGKRGIQLVINPDDLVRFTGSRVAPIARWAD